MARARGVKVGLLRLVVCWPFPERRIQELSAQVGALVMPEMNLGQMFWEMDRCARGRCKTALVPHAGGAVHDPETIFTAIMEAAR
jgi:2-oxoglutarate ferredoxin oxidoreductase subunit alpha